MRPCPHWTADWSAWVGRLHESFRWVRPWHLALGAAVALGFVLAEGEAIGLMIMAAALLLFALAWFREFAFLMRLADDDLPGRYDKPIWAFLLIALPPVGALVFWSFRRAHWPEAKPAADRSASDLT